MREKKRQQRTVKEHTHAYKCHAGFFFTLVDWCDFAMAWNETVLLDVTARARIIVRKM